MITYRDTVFTTIDINDAQNTWCHLYPKLDKEMIAIANFHIGNSDENYDYIAAFEEKYGLEERGTTFCTVVTMDQKEIGMVVYTVGNDHVEIRELYVEPEYRNKTLGMRLMLKVKEMAESKSIGVTTPGGNERAVRFYEQLGFKIEMYTLLYKPE